MIAVFNVDLVNLYQIFIQIWLTPTRLEDTQNANALP